MTCPALYFRVIDERFIQKWVTGRAGANKVGASPMRVYRSDLVSEKKKKRLERKKPHLYPGSPQTSAPGFTGVPLVANHIGRSI